MGPYRFSPGRRRPATGAARVTCLPHRAVVPSPRVLGAPETRARAPRRRWRKKKAVRAAIPSHTALRPLRRLDWRCAHTAARGACARQACFYAVTLRLQMDALHRKRALALGIVRHWVELVGISLLGSVWCARLGWHGAACLAD